MRKTKAQAKIPAALSPGEEAFALHCRAENLYPFRQWQFHPERKWKFDFAFRGEKIAIEVEGGIYSRVQGGHTRGKGYELNLEKYNAAVKLGWRVLRYSTDMVLAGTAMADVLELLKQEALQ
jgi:very-short-patch-repair endonuclease